MTTLDKQLQKSITKLHIYQALQELDKEISLSKKKVSPNYKPCYSI
jgi:hypothetical protein